MVEIDQINLIVVCGGVIFGTLFGLIAQSIRFCTLGAISDFLIYKNSTRAKMWLTALLSATISTQILIYYNAISPISSAFVDTKIQWFASLFGGTCFGFGMSLASGCGSRALIRFGEGNLKGLFVALVISFSALITLKGILSPMRVFFMQEINFSISKYSDLVSIISFFIWHENIVRGLLIWLITVILILILYLNVFRRKTFNRTNFKNYFFSIFLGLLITSGWFLTGNIGFLSEHPDTLENAFIATNSNNIESFTFIGPIAYLAELLMFWSDSSKKLTFGISLVIGTVIGSLISSLHKKTFKFEGFSSSTDFYNHLAGGVLMGVGGVIAVGCSIGHGLSGMSFLSLSSLIAIISIWIGAHFGLEFIQRYN